MEDWKIQAFPRITCFQRKEDSIPVIRFIVPNLPGKTQSNVWNGVGNMGMLETLVMQGWLYR